MSLVEKRNTIEKIAEKLYNLLGDITNEISEETDNETTEMDTQKNNQEDSNRLWGNRRYDVKELDTKGIKLFNEQQKFFKDSKVREENGNLKVVYHTTSKIGE